MAKRETRLPTLTDLKSLIEALNVRLGRSGDPLDRALTVRDVTESGMPVNLVRRGNEQTIEYSGESQGRILPPTPQGFAAQSMFGGVNLMWDAPAKAGVVNYTEVWRSASSDPTTRYFLTAESGNMVFDPLDRQDATLYYYWVRHVSVTGHFGAFAPVASAMAMPLVTDILNRLSDELADAPTTQGSPDETLILHAKRLAIRMGPLSDPVYPMIVATVNGSPAVVMNTALIANGSIQEGQLGAIRIGKIDKADGTPITTVGGLIKADAIQADQLSIGFGQVSGTLASTATGTNGQPLWAFYRNGGFILNSSTSGGRMEQAGDRISVFDSAGTLRVRMGRL